jgi:hypothetical protein
MTTTLGVVVGRFQTPELTSGHRHLLDVVEGQVSRLLIVIGETLGGPDKDNPLDFYVRYQMIKNFKPRAIVVPLFDRLSDSEWSRTLDSLCEGIARQNETVLMYGSRDSFLGHYYGKFGRVTVGEVMFQSATRMREIYRRNPIDNRDFRAGIVYGVRK